MGEGGEREISWVFNFLRGVWRGNWGMGRKKIEKLRPVKGRRKRKMLKGIKMLKITC